MSLRTEIRHSRHRAVERLLALRDEAKLQLHLLSLDAQRDFAQLDHDIAALELRASREGEHAMEAIKHSAQSLGRALKDLVATQASSSIGLLTSVRTVMTADVRSCSPDDSLTFAAHLMWTDDCGAIPVVADDKVVGVVTDRDVCMAAYTQGRATPELRVAGAMSRQLYGCGPDDSIGAALALMSDQRIRRLPVVDAEGRLVGILSLADVVRWAKATSSPTVGAAIIDTLAAISAPPRPQAAAAE